MATANDAADPVGEEMAEVLRLAEDDPIGFVSEWLDIKTWSGMRLVIDTVWHNQRTSVRACHGISKTITAAAIAVTFLNVYRPSIVITSAPTGRQVKELLWKEIRTIYQKHPYLSGLCQTLDVRVAPDWYMIGFATDFAQNIEGFHAPHILWVLDEAKGLPEWLYNAVEGSLTGGMAKVLEISTTDGADQQCPFRKHHTTERAKWKCIRLSAIDSPFVHPDEYPDLKQYRNPLLIKEYGKPAHEAEWSLDLSSEIQVATQAWIDDRRDSWEQTRRDLWLTKVLGEFSEAGESNVIPIAWIESAINAPVPEGGTEEWGLDVARFGVDMSVLTPRRGARVSKQITWGKKDTMETVGLTLANTKGRGIVKVDVIGIGAGVFDRLAEQGYAVIGINSSEKAMQSKLYINCRTEMWFHARDMFEQQYKHGGVLSIPDDPELIEELSGIRFRIRSDGLHRVEEKDDFKKRLGRSPDKGDSCVYALADYPIEEE
ncbi:MAG: hypothetical protein WC683_04365 [bacterium]